MQASGAALLALSKLCADVFVSGRPGKQSFQQRAQIETRAANYQRDTSSIGDLPQRGAPPSSIVAGREEFRRLDNIDQMMWNILPLLDC